MSDIAYNLGMLGDDVKALLNKLDNFLPSTEWEAPSGSDTYSKGSLVTHNNIIYQAKVNTQGEPGVSSDWRTINLSRIMSDFNNSVSNSANAIEATTTAPTEDYINADGLYKFAVLTNEPENRKQGYVYIIAPQEQMDAWMGMKVTTNHCSIVRVNYGDERDSLNTCNAASRLEWMMKFGSSVTLRIRADEPTELFTYSLPATVSCNVDYELTGLSTDSTGKYQDLIIAAHSIPDGGIITCTITATSRRLPKSTLAFKETLMV